MIYHANSEWLPGGFLGVEVFFVISGYLITLLLIAEQERTGRIHLGHFWLRRARRLLPALFVMLFLLITYTTIFRSDALGKLRGDVLAGVFYVSNWYQIWVGAGYSSTGDFAPLRHLWSLAVEEQFYLVWPLVMVVLLRVGTRRVFDVAKWLVVAALVITIAMALLYRQGRVGECSVTPGAYWTIADRCISKADALYLSTITRAGGLLFGSAFAMVWRPYAVMRGPLRDKGRLMDLLAIVGLAATRRPDLVRALRHARRTRPVAVPRWISDHVRRFTARDRRRHPPALAGRSRCSATRCSCGSAPARTGCTSTTGRSIK